MDGTKINNSKDFTHLKESFSVSRSPPDKRDTYLVQSFA